MTEPLTPPDCDLRDFAFMPLDIVRLFNSRFHAVATDAEWRAGVTLWLKSFHQVPAGSIPDDEVELCRLAELGRDLKAWRKLRDVALHGWVKCIDGRWYHPVVCEKANEAWQRKLVQRERSRKGNEKRWGTGIADGIQAASPAAPQTVLEGSPKGSQKEPAGIPLTIPRDRDRDREREEKNLNLSSEGRAGAREAVAPRAPQPPPPLTDSALAELGALTARLEGRARGQPFLTPPPPRRTVAEQVAAVAPERPPKASIVPPEVLAKARKALGQRTVKREEASE